MAEEEIIIIEEEDAAGLEDSFEAGYEELEEGKETTDSNPSSKNKTLFIGIGLALLFILIMVFLFSGSDDDSADASTIEISKEQTKKESPQKISSSQLESMITHANTLYEKGHKKEALKLYERISTYSESISYYNLGVAQLHEQQYEKAISSFDLAIKSQQHMCVSAINAAVASLELGKTQAFKSYINLAHTYLPQEAASPMYSYYYALINFYQDNYLEALSPLQHRSSDDYTHIQNQLSAKINVLFSSYHKAIANLEEEYQDESALSLGLLYANLGDFILAKKYLRMAIAQGIDPSKAQMALTLVNLKAGQIKAAAKLLESTTDMYPDTANTHYPIEVTLKESLFDIDLAQNNFHENIIHNDTTIYQILFYFSPFKIFNANQSISYIRKGNANISIDNISNATKEFSQGAKLSNVNLNIAQAIGLALNFHLHEANDRLLKMSKLYPRHSIVHYNLALTYAQLGEISLAYKHFLKSYHLDAKNYLSGVFTIMCAKLINQDNQKFQERFIRSLSLEPKNEEYDFYRALVHFKDLNFPATYNWMERPKKDSPLYLAFDMLIAMSMNKDSLAQEYSQKLIRILPNDILPHLLYIDSHYSDLEQKLFARKAINHLKRQKFNMNDFYYGPFITKYLYIQYAQITGALYPLRKQIRKRLNSESTVPIGLTQSLALVSIFTQNFEEAYTLYNQLIDDYKQQDPHTLFLAAIAATGAAHPANAIALLELARRKSPHHNDSRFALGLLYLQLENNDGAVISFKYISEVDFQSQYFNF
ncbi:MAG TPA: tetratricopeptide repeat protein, partial [Sulfurimonas sp.]|nr:tetratricopeptide repeat protein [Sulfurimonas sp.]